MADTVAFDARAKAYAELQTTMSSLVGPAEVARKAHRAAPSPQPYSRSPCSSACRRRPPTWTA